MYADGIVPTYLGSFLVTTVSFIIIGLLIYANHRLVKYGPNTKS